MVGGNGLRRPHLDAADKQSIRQVHSRLDDTETKSSAPATGNALQSGSGSRSSFGSSFHTRSGQWSSTGTGLGQRPGTGNESGQQISADTDNQNALPISHSMIFSAFLEGLTEENMNIFLCQISFSNFNKDVLWTNVVSEMSHLPSLFTFSIPASDLFIVYSTSYRILQATSAGLNEVHAAV